MTNPDRDNTRLEAQADGFAAQLNDTIEHSLITSQRFRSNVAGTKFVVTTHEPGDDLKVSPLLLTLENVPMITLDVTYWCMWDRPEHFLAVEKSNFIVRAHGVDNPLFRFDYVRDPVARVPVSHVQVHAHRDEFVHLLTRSKRVARTDNLGAAALSRFHFPTGGHRFRPCLEDLLEVLINEFNLDRPQTWKTALAQGREQWRAIQLKTAVRDAPEEAVSTLERLGYTVDRSNSPSPSPASQRLHDL